MQNTLLKFSEDHNEVYLFLSVQTKQEISKLERTQIEKWLNDNGASDFFIFDSTISSAILITQSSPVSTEEHLLIAERRDATLSIRLSEDNMHAYLHCKGAYGGRAIKGSEVLITIRAAGVNRGVKKNLLQKIFHRAVKLKAGEEFDAIFAMGKLPVNGENGKLVYFVEDNKARILQPQDRGDGTVDMRNLGKLLMVEPEQPLAKLVNATEGIDGFTVTGEVLVSEHGQELILNNYQGSYIDLQKNNIIFAKIPGIVTLHKDGVEVLDAICFDAISIATGHVNFTGSVIINNDVEAGMKVEATGSVMVGGAVESAIIVSGADVIVKNGILGRQPDENEALSCSIKAKGAVMAKFAQYANIQAKKNITITHNAAHCDTFTEGDLIITDDNHRNGILNGGHHVAHGKIEVVTMGTNSETTTYVEASAVINVIQSKIHKLYLQLNDLLERHQIIQSFGMKMLELPIEKRSKELSSALVAQKSLCEDKINKIRLELKKLQKQIEEHLSSNDIKIYKHCHSGLYCKFGELQLYVTSEHSGCRFYAHDEAIHRDPL